MIRVTVKGESGGVTGPQTVYLNPRYVVSLKPVIGEPSVIVYVDERPAVMRLRAEFDSMTERQQFCADMSAAVAAVNAGLVSL